MSSEQHGALAGTGDPSSMSLSGRIEEHCFAEILRNLLRSKDTAIVRMERERVAKCVHVQNGRIVFAQSSDPDDRLGECLLREGMISVEQYDQSGRLIRPGKKQGTILVELGYITPAELVKGVRLQVEHVVTDLLSWRQGAFRIDMGDQQPADVISLNISTESLLFRGIKRGAGWSQVLRGLGGTLDSTLLRTADFDTTLYKLDLADDESHVVSLVNGRLSAAQVCAMSYLSNHDTCLTLYALTCCGVIEAGHPRDAETLFREQVAELEMQEIREAISSFAASLAKAAAALRQASGPAGATALEAAAASILDEHWDVLHESRLETGTLDEAAILENLEAIEPGSRLAAVEKALAAARHAACAAAGSAEGAVRQAFGNEHDARKDR